MRHEILKKTLLYRLLAYVLGICIGILSPLSIGQSFFWATLGEGVSVVLYYIYEHSWRRYIDHRLLKKGINVLSINGDSRVRIAYEVIEDLGEGQLIIKVV